MKLSMAINYAGGFKEAVDRVVELEKAGLDQVWVAEAYSFDAISQVGYLAAKTETVEIGTGIVNVYSRTAALMAMTAAGCDYVSDGRFILGLGASGPQVVEGFHGVPYEKPMQRIKEYIEACRMIWDREEKFDYHGQTVEVPLPAGEGTGLGKPLKLINHPVRKDIPIWWASLKGLSVEATAELADGWLPIMFFPEQLPAGVGRPAQGRHRQARPEPQAARDLRRRHAGHRRGHGRRQKQKVLDLARPGAALYVGGMGARGKNFYNDICRDYGFEKEAVDIQDLYLEGKKDEAAAAIPTEWLEVQHLVGPKSFIKERVGAFKEAGVTVLSVNPVGPNAVEQIETLREIVDGCLRSMTVEPGWEGVQEAFEANFASGEEVGAGVRRLPPRPQGGRPRRRSLRRRQDASRTPTTRCSSCSARPRASPRSPWRCACSAACSTTTRRSPRTGRSSPPTARATPRSPSCSATSAG